MAESITNEVDIPDVEAIVMKLVLQYIYSGQVDLQESNLIEVLDCAEKYDLSGLKILCFNKMCNFITEENVGMIALKMHLYNGDPDLKMKVLEFCHR